ncbi:UDP-N-acetylmuramoyl-tripeptide--D-alanyl-D-alanine ligase [Blochmannia endosymbiont of Camponotus sp.]|uniref:UDP-N-acetylmuramoyl-tripeptide--D-alanyl-D- alanine ligase n=1 Tax=Blochmannia endosymbiont of Camponotus sp. TaxID=700220 RepID=UPI00202456FB|nr:UDP-N-acetylmuramoyl-tripeptide--D-alanyl-D-alanine ligase [Blochmannia endosymbiont of Camponotus sp.]URJ24059.1 UDP-N-acetylmuramoyl-tripeptide--D-alanyl-D-alanine ligase [Blochmannia endosymbiont of Camponotus sp.]URJ25747.1 UDP-N-acetylmuramoyl-tripeptide--D-alanyl-D-alanine ligase [Blochmannia endosymbiont of Camponotus sp.]
MIPFSLHEIAPVLNAKYIGMDLIIHAITINSNVIYKQCMFIALIGKRFDGHDFTSQAIVAGAQALLVNHHVLLDVPQLIVPDTRCALIMLAHWVRQKASAKVIAITGSSGKTSVKEMTASILKGCGHTIATQGNFNNMVGVPITLLRLTKKNSFAIIELGASSPGELAQLSKVVAANVALVNNVYPAHLSGFKSLAKIGKEKGEIFSELDLNGKGIINADSHALSLWRKSLKGKSMWFFSLRTSVGIDFFASNIIAEKNGTRFILHTPYGTSPVVLSMLGTHNVANALAASALAFSVGADLSEVVYGLENIKTLPGRLFPIILGEGKLLLDDTYNSNVGSMISAIHVLTTMPGYRILVVSDMLELGKHKSIKYHCYIGKLISTTNINKILTIGSVSYCISKICGKGKHFRNKNKLIIYIKQMLSTHNSISVLVKGSRGFKMEQIINAIRDGSTCYFG